jgi:hypothetical protein
VPIPPKEDSHEEIQLDSTNLGTTSLQNSEVMENLDQKFSYLQDQEKVN